MVRKKLAPQFITLCPKYTYLVKFTLNSHANIELRRLKFNAANTLRIMPAAAASIQGLSFRRAYIHIFCACWNYVDGFVMLAVTL